MLVSLPPPSPINGEEGGSRKGSPCEHVIGSFVRGATSKSQRDTIRYAKRARRPYQATYRNDPAAFR